MNKELNMKNFNNMVGKEYTVLDFSNELIELGCADIFENGELDYLIRDAKNISVDTNVYDEDFEEYKELDFELALIKDNENIHEVIIEVLSICEL